MAYCTPAEVREMGAGLTTSGAVSLTDSLLRSLIERASRFFDLACGVPEGYFDPAYYPEWQSNHVYVVGDIVTPTTGSSHKYRVTTAGTSGSSEPTWPTTSAGTVTTGTAVFTENGADVVATDKVIYGDGTNYLRLPPYVAGSLNATITVPDNYTVPEFVEKDGFLIRSSNGLLLSGWNRPFMLTGAGWYEGVAITVSAIWGYESTPADVKMAVIELAINLFRETDPAHIKLINLEGQPLRERMPPRVAEVAKRYRVKASTGVFV